MKLFALAAVAALLLSSPAAALDIRHDRGGIALNHAVKFARASKPIRVFGTCMSACTLALKYLSTCAGPNASFHFHAATHPRITQWMMAQYKPAIRSWIRGRGGLTSRMITLRGAELRRLVRSCS